MGQEEIFLYQACGLLKMKIYLDADKKYFGILEQDKQENSKPIDLIIPKLIQKRLNKNFLFSELVNSNKPLICLVYPKTGNDFTLNFCILKYLYLNESKAPYELGIFKIRGQVHYVYFENQAVLIKIVPQSERLKYFYIAIKYQDIKQELRGIKCRQHWEIDAKLVNHQLTIESAKKIKDKKGLGSTTDVAPSQAPTVKTSDVVTNEDETEKNNPCDVVENETKKAESKKKGKEKSQKFEEISSDSVDNTSDIIPHKPLVVESPIINVVEAKPEASTNNRPMQVKSEVVVKISGALPQATPAPNKKVQVEVTDQNGINFTAVINGKSWKKAEANVAQFADWAGAISGKLGKTEQGLEIIDAGIQIFEKKPKEVKQEETKQEDS
ncbi:hypothetical protein NIES4071_106400 (plasmid) [Calothrix sp. NIES-4071]|nr:hypothetical protein NIES4071_106400 [Calothrix sp. NIES-4071]BAZ65058.1 hypothetical protein NIES4105_107910 [Calothrix sp. NIES-4105]